MNLALLFSYGISAELWRDKGILDREKLLYEKLLEKKAVDKIYWLTYGAHDKSVEKALENDIEIIPLPRVLNSKIGILFYSLFVSLIQRDILKKADILKTNQMNGSWAAVIAKMLFKKKLIVRTGYTWSLFAEKRYPRSIKIFFIKLIERFAFAFSDGVVVSSSHDLDFLNKHYSLQGIGKVIPNYIDTDLFKPLHVEKEENTICFVGRLTHQKNILSLLKAMSGMPYTLSIIGSGDEKARLKSYARTNRINVRFLGDIENSKLPALLNKHELFILPSLYEGTPKALLEAMACGLPCIGTDVEGIREVLIHNENGYLCAPDFIDIKSAISAVLSNMSLRNRISHGARETVLKNYSLTAALEKEIQLYRELIHEPG